MKYEKEARVVLGVALVRINDGRTEGQNTPPFDYTEKPISREDDWRKLYCEANTIIKGNEGLGGWKCEYIEAGCLYKNGTIWIKKGLIKGLEKRTKMLNGKGFTTMSELKLTCLDNDRESPLVAEVSAVYLLIN